MSGVLVLYLLWAAKSPLNMGSQGGSQTPPSSTPPGIPPIQPPNIGPPNPMDPCNPIYVQLWGPMDCEADLAKKLPPTPQGVRD